MATATEGTATEDPPHEDFVLEEEKFLFMSNSQWQEEAKLSFDKAVKHFNKFCNQITSETSSAIFGQNVAYPMSFDQLDCTNTPIATLDAFAYYLVHAKHLNNQRRYLARNTADRYLSAFKIGVIRHGGQGQDGYRQHPFSDDATTKRIRETMLKTIVKRNVVLKVADEVPHTEASENDLMAIAVACIFSDDEKQKDMACFASFANTLFQLAGRGSETAYLDWDKLKVVAPNQFDAAEKLAEIAVDRLKTLHHQCLSIFPHASHYLLDWYFLRLYHMVLDDDPNEHFFPLFYDQARQVEVPGFPDFDPNATGEEAVEALNRHLAKMVNEQRNDRKKRKLAQQAHQETAKARAGNAGDGSGVGAASAPQMDKADESPAPQVDEAEDPNDDETEPANKSTPATNTDETGADAEEEKDESIPARANDDSGSPEGNSSSSKKRSKRKSGVDQGVSKLFKTFVGAAQELIESLKSDWDEVTKDADMPFFRLNDIGSHGPKKGAVNKASENPNIQTRWLSDRCGWVWKALNTLFDYLTAKKTVDQQVARALSNWDTTEDGSLQGGRPPTIQALAKPFPEACGESEEDANEETLLKEYKLCKSIVKQLFMPYEKLTYSMNEDDLAYFHQLLFASGLMRLDRFKRLLLAHPKKKFGTTNEELYQKHKFLTRILHVAENHGVDVEQLERWGRKIRFDFIIRNVRFVPNSVLTDLPEHSQLRKDLGSMQKQMNNLNSKACEAIWNYGNTAESVVGLRNDVGSMRSDLSARVASLEQNLRIVQTQNDQLRQQNAQIISLLTQLMARGGSQGEVQLPVLGLAQLPQTGITGRTQADRESEVRHVRQVSFPANLFPKKKGGTRIKWLFEMWYRQGFHTAYGQVRGNRTLFKNAVELFTLFTDEHVRPLPQGVVGPLAPGTDAWHDHVKRLTEDAWTKFEVFYSAEPIMQPGRDGGDLEPKDVPENMGKFMDYMFDNTHRWPEGPSGSLDLSFQPRGENQRGEEKIHWMWSRKKLLEQYEKRRRLRETRKKPQRKRKAQT